MNRQVAIILTGPRAWRSTGRRQDQVLVVHCRGRRSEGAEELSQARTRVDAAKSTPCTDNSAAVVGAKYRAAVILCYGAYKCVQPEGASACGIENCQLPSLDVSASL